MSIAALSAFVLIPPLNCLAAACVGAVLHRRRVGQVLLAAGLGGLVVFAMPLVSGTLLTGLERGLSTTPPDTDKPAAIVILSGDEADVLEAGVATTMVGHLTLERERAGAALARRTGLPVLVTGGVIDPGDATLAAIMSKSLLADFGVTVAWKEERSTDTWENAQFSAAILRKAGIRSVYLVSHAWHLRRALIAFRAAGITATAAPVAMDEPPRATWHNVVPHVSSWQASFYALHEWIGIVWYELRA
jgi:uncharacterized SAM-binding protein YcdF (DUF218 family)